MEPQQPGQTITPQSQDNRAEVVTSEQFSSKPNELTEPEAPFKAAEDSASFFKTEKGSKTNQKDKISWTASEFVEHKKSPTWYLGLLVAGAALAALIFFTTHDKISTSVIVLAVLVMGVFAARKPKPIEYILDDAGLTIGNKFYGYELFKSFSVVDEGVVNSIYLLPLKRFMPALSIYYAGEDEDKIVNIFSERLPFEHRQLDAIDNLMHRIRF